ncbi:MAG TPA: hypothetical protein VGB19_11060 [Actinomycetota bacterium]
MRPSIRMALSVTGVLACLTGAVFFLQGVGILGGSFMSSTITWTVIGALMVAGGAALLSLGKPNTTRRGGR